MCVFTSISQMATTTTCGLASCMAEAHSMYTLSVYLLIISYFCYRRQLSKERARVWETQALEEIRSSTGATQRPGVLLSIEGYSLSPPGSEGPETLARAAQNSHIAVATCFPAWHHSSSGFSWDLMNMDMEEPPTSPITCTHIHTHTHTSELLISQAGSQGVKANYIWRTQECLLSLHRKPCFWSIKFGANREGPPQGQLF